MVEIVVDVMSEDEKRDEKVEEALAMVLEVIVVTAVEDVEVVIIVPKGLTRQLVSLKTLFVSMGGGVVRSK